MWMPALQLDQPKGDRMADERLVIEFEYERDTKNKVRFTELSPREDMVIGKLYLDRSAHEALGAPKRLTATLAPV